MASLPPPPLPETITSSFVNCQTSCGLTFHTLQAGDPSDKLILLVHGYPELAFSWRKIMPTLAAAGYHVVAFDQRGYGRTTGWDAPSWEEVDLSQFLMTQLVRDVLSLVAGLGRTQVDCIVGHDFGAVTCAMCALMRPDFFKSAVQMSHPFPGSSPLPLPRPVEQSGQHRKDEDIQKALAALTPPRKHYKWYNSASSAVQDWDKPAQGLKAFLRGYVHLKSAKYAVNKPHPLKSFTAPELAKMPSYYIMPLEKTMTETIADDMVDEDVSATEDFLSDADLDFYVQEWQRTGFLGGLSWYRSGSTPGHNKELLLFAGKKIEVPCAFVSGAQDWGNYQEPGAIESYPKTCTDFRGITMIDNAGHWPQQEQPEAVSSALLGFLASL